MIPASDNKTGIVCTIGPSLDNIETLSEMLHAGMNVARLYFSHGDTSSHRATIANLRKAAELTGVTFAILGDLPGPKIRIGKLVRESVELAPGDRFVLSTDDFTGVHLFIDLTRSVFFLSKPLLIRG